MLSIFKYKSNSSLYSNMNTEYGGEKTNKIIKKKSDSTNPEIGRYNIENYTDFCYKRNPCWKINQTKYNFFFDQKPD